MELEEAPSSFGDRLTNIEKILGNDEKGLVKDIKEIKELLTGAKYLIVIIKIVAFIMGVIASIAVTWTAFIHGSK